MPLNNTLPEDIAKTLREIPLDEDSRCGCYQTMVQVYDRKCKGCGFARITLRGKRINAVTSDLDKALKIAVAHGAVIERGCSYPADIVYKGTKPIYPSLPDIVSNTCLFWRIEPELYFPVVKTELEPEEVIDGILV